jgi:arsenite-transporting ATPase
VTRIVLFTGKGGVGKTTVAAATAVRAAAAGKRVLITSTDPAHSLADAFDQPLEDGPTPILGDVGGDGPGRLLAQQIDAQARLEHHWRDVRDYLVELLAFGGVGEVQAEELVLLPGLDEIFSLIDLRKQVESGKHDLIVVDCAPTAETLRLLALPDALRWYVERMLQPGRRVAKAVRPVVNRLGGAPMPQDEVFGAVESIHADLARVHAILQDATRSTVRLVVNPERMVVAEAIRTATSLALFGYAVDAVIVNRVLPDEITDPYLAKWKLRHAEHLATIESSFAPTPILQAPLYDDELVGAAGLARLGDTLYRDTDETAVLFDGQPLRVERTEGGYRLRLSLPFATKDEVGLHRRQNELHVHVGSVKRTIPLPAALTRCQIGKARLRDGHLDVDFLAPDAKTTAPSRGRAGARS